MIFQIEVETKMYECVYYFDSNASNIWFLTFRMVQACAKYWYIKPELEFVTIFTLYTRTHMLLSGEKIFCSNCGEIQVNILNINNEENSIC